jgi:hypothetical protein
MTPAVVQIEKIILILRKCESFNSSTYEQFLNRLFLRKESFNLHPALAVSFVYKKLSFYSLYACHSDRSGESLAPNRLVVKKLQKAVIIQYLSGNQEYKHKLFLRF